MKRITLTCCAAALLFFSCNNEKSTGDEIKPVEDSAAATTPETAAVVPDSATMNKAMMDYGTPGEMQKLLASFNGTWKGEMTMWMDPVAPPSQSTFTATYRMILNGLYQETISKGNVGGMAFEGRGIWGYDNAKKKFVSTWIDNMGSGIAYSEGDYDSAAKTITLTGKMTNPLDGKDFPLKEVLKIVDDNTQVIEMYQPAPGTGQEYKSMELRLTRSK